MNNILKESFAYFNGKRVVEISNPTAQQQLDALMHQAFMTALGNMFTSTANQAQNTAARAAGNRNASGAVPPVSEGTVFSGSSITSTTTEPAWVNANQKYLVVNGNLTINGSPAWLNQLEHLYVRGSLTISGTVNMNRVVGVYIQGEGLANNANLLTVSAGATLRGNPARRAVTDENGIVIPGEQGSIIGTYFIVGNSGTGARMNMVPNVSIFDCRFYVPGEIIFNSGNNSNANLLGNSMFVAYGTPGTINLGSGNGTVTGNSNDNAPQFYARVSITFQPRGNPRFHGLFASPSVIFPDTSSTTGIHGFVLANTIGGMAHPPPPNTLGGNVVLNLIDQGAILDRVISEIEPRFEDGKIDFDFLQDNIFTVRETR
jgi:hypothetical protein